MEKTSPLFIEHTLEGKTFLAIQKAAAEFLRRYQADLTEYQITVIQEKDKCVVLFIRKDRPKGTYGHIAGKPGFEVEFNPHDFTIRNAHFTR